MYKLKIVIYVILVFSFLSLSACDTTSWKDDGSGTQVPEYNCVKTEESYDTGATGQYGFSHEGKLLAGNVSKTNQSGEIIGPGLVGIDEICKDSSGHKVGHVQGTNSWAKLP